MRLTLFFTSIFTCISVVLMAQVQIPDYKTLAAAPNANYHQITGLVRGKLAQKKQELLQQGVNVDKSQQFREELAHFERWALEWRDRVGADGKFPNRLTGWINAMAQNPEQFRSQIGLQMPTGISSVPWTSIGPVNSGVLNGWTYGGGIGRVNVVRRHPQNLQTLFAGTATGGLFRSTDLGTSWTPLTDQFAGLGVSDLVLLPNNSAHMLMATGDYDGSQLNSIGIFKSTDGGNTWVPGITFTIDQNIRIARLYIDPDYATNSTVWATFSNGVLRSTDGGSSWTTAYTNNDERVNDIIKIGGNYFITSKWGNFYKSTDGTGTDYTLVFPATASTSSNRLDFSYSPAAPDVLFMMSQSNPAFAKYTISTNTMGTFTNITNTVPADGNGNYNTQQGYNQVITVNPANPNEIIVGEFSAKRSTDGGTTWSNYLNGYYDPSSSSNWGTGYVHSDHHFIDFTGAANDSLLIGNDGGVYVGPINTTPFAYKECFNGMVCTQSYSLSIFNAEPNNIMIGNQDNDGRSRNYVGTTATWYGASAGDGISTAIHRTNKDIRFLTGTSGSLSWRSDAYAGNWSGKRIGTPAQGVFAAPLEMHLTNGDILYGGYDDLYKSTGIVSSGDPGVPDNANWVNLNSGLGGKPKFIGLSNHPIDAAKQRIVVIGENNVIRKTVDETSWTTITPPSGVTFNSIYWSRNSDTMVAIAGAYTAGSKIFFSADAGTTWTNISDNMPNIQMKNIIRYEGTDTVLVATELGVYFARLNPAGGVLRPTGTGWTKFGVGLPNVRVEDMEISYAKKQLFIATWGRGVWAVDLSLIPVALNNIDFTYTAGAGNHQYNLRWKIEVPDIAGTTLEKSANGSNFTAQANFTDGRKTAMQSWPVTLENEVEYYRLKYTRPDGKSFYSAIIKLAKKKTVQVAVYPNPVSGYVYVNSSTKLAAVSIFAQDGRQFAHAKPNSNFYYFDMALLPAGTYIIKTEDVNGNINNEKVVHTGK